MLSCLERIAGIGSLCIPSLERMAGGEPSCFLHSMLILKSLVLEQALVKVVTVYRDNDEVTYAKPGENLRLRLSGIEEEDISQGFVLSAVSKYLHFRFLWLLMVHPCISFSVRYIKVSTYC